MRMKTFILASGTAAALALSAGAASAEPDGWYGAVDAGYHHFSDPLNAESQVTGNNWNFDVNDGWA
ncbi:MAG: cell envelope biogenesis protein OmpA, partial [Brevundimonas sp.]